MKGIVLAGGTGSRLHPVTFGVSKQLLPIYDKPMIYYPISVLMLSGISEIAIISTEDDLPSFQRLLGTGESLGLTFTYIVQPAPEGIAQAFILAKDFLGQDSACLVLGDNIFFGHGLSEKLKAARTASEAGLATVFGYQVKDPHRYGIVEFDDNRGALSIEEKPSSPKSNYAVTGLYFYPNSVVEKTERVTPSSRGELEITTLNNIFLESGCLQVEILGRGFAWMDAGTHDALFEVSNFVQSLERRQGYKIACLEEIALSNGWVKPGVLMERARTYGDTPYRQYVLELCEN